MEKSVIINGKKISCNMTVVSILLGGKWKPLILWQLVNGPVRFGELRKNLIDISPRILSKELKELEADGIIVRTAYPTVIPKVEYQLSEHGREMKHVLDAMCEWGKGYIEKMGS